MNLRCVLIIKILEADVQFRRAADALFFFLYMEDADGVLAASRAMVTADRLREIYLRLFYSL